jgi:predicted nucleic acid-binding protein
LALILDTNALSAFADGDEQLRRVIEKTAQLAVPVIVLGEYMYGVRQSRHQVSYQRWLDAHLPLFDLLPIGRETAYRYADLRRELKSSGHPIPSNDVWIAAIAREHDLPVLSKDSHFEFVPGLQRLTW